MKIKVLFFASLREEIGFDQLEVQLAEGSTTSSLLDELSTRIGNEALTLLRGDSVRMALNHEVLEGVSRLQDSDEVAYFPQVTGG